MICPKCGAETSEKKGFCFVCGARFDSSVSKKSTPVKKIEPKKTIPTETFVPAEMFVPTETIPRRKTVIDSSFISGTVFAIMGFVLYMIFLGGVIDETEANVSRMFERAFGFSNETVSWTYISMIFLPMLFLPAGFVAFVSGADQRKTSGAEIIKVGMVVQLVCTLVTFVANCIEFFPNTGDFFENITMRLKFADEFSSQYEIVGMAFFELFFKLIHPFVFILWSIGTLHGISAVSKRIKYKRSESRPSSLAIFGGSVLGVLRILMVVFFISIIIIEENNRGGSVAFDMNMEGYMVFFGYVFVSVAMISFSVYFSHASEAGFCMCEEPGDKAIHETSVKIAETAETPETIPVSSPSPIASPKPSGICTVCGRTLCDGEVCNCADNADVLKTCKFCIYCMKPLAEGEMCSCAEARAEAERKTVKHDAISERKPEYIGDSRVNINMKHRKAPESVTEKEKEEGAKMFSAAGDL